MKFIWEIKDVIPGIMVAYQKEQAAIATTNFDDARGDVFSLVTTRGAFIWPPKGFTIYEMVNHLNKIEAVPIKNH